MIHWSADKPLVYADMFLPLLKSGNLIACVWMRGEMRVKFSEAKK